MKKTYFFLLFATANIVIASTFTSLHDSTKAYTHPSFVISNSDPYRTLKSVPANIDINNTEYWSNLKTEATQQTIPVGSETPPSNINTQELANQSPGTNNTPVAPPTFTSATSATFAENLTGTVYTAAATGADTYSISGEDSSLFSITDSGVLTFKVIPDYEDPQDQGGDNNHSIIITATNTGGSSQITLSILVTDDTSDNPVPPVFTSATSATFAENSTGTTYTALATGADSYSISGDDSSLFTINSATGVLTFNASPDYENPTDQGSDNAYTLTITATNTGGSTELSLTVTVTDDTSDSPSPVAVQYGVSSRGYCGPLTGDNADPLIAGFIVADANKSVIVVASGPSLPAELNPISDPSVYVVNLATGTIVYPGLNNNWKDNADVSDITNSGRAPTNDLDSAIILRNLEPGTYSAICFGTDGSTNPTGTALIEVYEFDDGQPSESRFEGLSTRGYCGPLSTGPRIVGFAVQGDAGTTVDLYVAAKGPSLAGSVSNPISDPALYVVDMTTGAVVTPGLIDNWKDGADKDLITSIGRAPGADADAALILRDLPPGVYSAIAYGINDVEGTVLVEVYDVDIGE